MKKYFLVSIVAVLLSSACARESAPQTQTREGRPAAPAEKQPVAVHIQGELFQLSDGTSARFYGEADVRGKERFTMETGSAGPGIYYFSPTVLIGSPGQALTLEIVNTTGEGHPFNIASPSKSGAVEAGGKTTLTVQFPSAGAVTFSCPHTRHAGELRAV